MKKLKNLLDAHAEDEYCSQDEPPSDYDSADEPFDKPDWKTKRIKLKRLPDKDYYCSECCRSHEILALKGIELAYCVNCSRASGSDCYICAKCYSRWQRKVPETDYFNSRPIFCQFLAQNGRS